MSLKNNRNKSAKLTVHAKVKDRAELAKPPA